MDLLKFKKQEILYFLFFKKSNKNFSSYFSNALLSNRYPQQIHSLKNTITFAGYALLSAEHLCSKCDYYAEHWKPTAVEKEYFV